MTFNFPTYGKNSLRALELPLFIYFFWHNESQSEETKIATTQAGIATEMLTKSIIGIMADEIANFDFPSISTPFFNRTDLCPLRLLSPSLPPSLVSICSFSSSSFAVPTQVSIVWESGQSPIFSELGVFGYSELRIWGELGYQLFDSNWMDRGDDQFC